MIEIREKLKFVLILVLATLFSFSSAFEVFAIDKASTEEDQYGIEAIDPVSVAADGEEALPDEVEGEEGGEEEDRELTEEELAAAEAAEEARFAALRKRAEALEEEVSKISKDKLAIISLLTNEENQEPLYESAVLLKSLIEALLSEKNPKYSEIGKYGRELCRLERSSSLGFYAQGLGAMYGKKPNLKQAMDFLGKASKGRKPYKAAALAYYTCIAKRFGLYAGIALAAIVFLIVFAVMKKKKLANSGKGEVASIKIDGSDLQKLIDQPSADSSASLGSLDSLDSTKDFAKEIKAQEENVEIEGLSSIDSKASEIPNPVESSPEILQQTSEQLEKDSVESLFENQVDKLGENSVESSIEEVRPKESRPETESSIHSEAPQTDCSELGSAFGSLSPSLSENRYAHSMQQDSSTTTSSVSYSGGKKIIRIVKRVRLRRDANGNTYTLPDDGSGLPSSSNYQTKAQMESEMQSLKGIIRPSDRPLPPVDTQLDLLWSNLSRKAMQGHISPMARKTENIGRGLGQTMPFYSSGSGEGYYGSDNRLSDIRLGDVSIDLSEEALKDDLIGKLKMLAITDSELRELFAIKNPAHIPHLIEYVMTKPEPMRLAFVAKELGNYNDPAIIDTLSSLLYHDDERVVLGAIQGLECSKSPDAVIPLCPFLRSEIPLYAQAARTALSKFGAVKIMQALKDLPSFTDNKIKEAGIFVLSRMSGSPVEKILKALLNDESSEVRIQAILAMSYQKNPVYIEALREFYRIANENEKSMTRKAIVYLNGFNN